MSIKYADDIIKEIEERGPIQVPEGYVTGEEFEEWLRRDKNNTEAQTKSGFNGGFEHGNKRQNRTIY